LVCKDQKSHLSEIASAVVGVAAADAKIPKVGFAIGRTGDRLWFLLAVLITGVTDRPRKQKEA
jgi:hypothetical protein